MTCLVCLGTRFFDPISYQPNEFLHIIYVLYIMADYIKSKCFTKGLQSSLWSVNNGHIFGTESKRRPENG